MVSFFEEVEKRMDDMQWVEARDIVIFGKG